MKPNFQNAIEDCRIKRGPMTSNTGNPFGAFVFRDGKTILRVIAAPPHPNGTGWEHVSVSAQYQTAAGKTKLRTPTWDEMCRMKSIFFSEDETAIQFHPASAVYVNYHPHTLHLWKWAEGTFPMPSHILVGPSGNLEKDLAAASDILRRLDREQ
jgi:hypothetical protein